MKGRAPGIAELHTEMIVAGEEVSQLDEEADECILHDQKYVDTHSN